MPCPKIDQQVTFLICSDLEKCTGFYRELLGLDQVLGQGGCRIFRICEDSFLGFCQREGVVQTTDGVVYTFVTDEVDEWYAYLKERDIDLVKEPEENPAYNIYHFFFRDPDGYLLEVQKFLDPRWPSKGSFVR